MSSLVAVTSTFPTRTGAEVNRSAIGDAFRWGWSDRDRYDASARSGLTQLISIMVFRFSCQLAHNEADGCFQFCCPRPSTASPGKRLMHQMPEFASLGPLWLIRGTSASLQQKVRVDGRRRGDNSRFTRGSKDSWPRPRQPEKLAVTQHQVTSLFSTIVRQV